MKSKYFVTERGRPIEIVVDTHISFQFPNESNREFYWIEIDDWKKDSDYWINHMSMKTWYSPAMTYFINQSVNGYSEKSA